MEVTLETTIYDLLKEYPFLEDELIKINPKFKKLKNPILKRTIARVATIKQAAFVGGMKPVELLNKIREILGQEKLDITLEEEKEPIPLWITNEPKVTLNANELLDQEKNPLAEVRKALKEIKEGEVILIKSDFQPQPLIDEFKKEGHKVFSQQVGENEFFTYIKKA